MIFNPEFIPLAILTVVLVLFALVLEYLDVLK